MIRSEVCLATLGLLLLGISSGPAWGDLGIPYVPLPNDQCCNKPTYGDPDPDKYPCFTNLCDATAGSCAFAEGTVAGAQVTESHCSSSPELFCQERKVFKRGITPPFACVEVASRCDPGEVTCVLSSSLWDADEPEDESGDFTCRSLYDLCSE